jgi:hypothetical protein
VGTGDGAGSGVGVTGGVGSSPDGVGSEGVGVDFADNVSVGVGVGVLYAGPSPEARDTSANVPKKRSAVHTTVSAHPRPVSLYPLILTPIYLFCDEIKNILQALGLTLNGKELALM